MFTGIITAVGTIAGIDARQADRRLRIEASGLPWQEFVPGESIAVNGTCLTAVSLHDTGFDTDVSVETLAVTTLGRLVRGSRVNLEPALALGERLGGHLVSGHVDGVATVTARVPEGRSVRLEFEAPRGIDRYIARKGSVCVDGVSLTVNEVSGNTFGVVIIPHTLGATIIGDYRPGTDVNIEVDQMARYLERLLGAGDGLTHEFLKAHGYG